mmetsp:Transcript_32597/g.77324  ORF Transcript_32597/g.77324 Transcript_32597/m.77324 type:complete len:223 (-) Transcript_32597:120-788(-)
MRIGVLRCEKPSSAESAESPKKRPCVQWDEDNLALNEIVKSELDCQKIDEPDTPFVRSPLRDDDSDAEQEPPAVQLTTDAKAVAKIEELLKDQGEGAKKSGARFSLPEPSNSDAEQVPNPGRSSGPMAWSRQESGELEGAAVSDGGPGLTRAPRRMSNGEPLDLPSHDLSPSEVPHLVRKTSFEKKRQEHYNLKDALRRGKELLEEEDEEEAAEEEVGGEHI